MEVPNVNEQLDAPRSRRGALIPPDQPFEMWIDGKPDPKFDYEQWRAEHPLPRRPKDAEAQDIGL